MNEFQKNNTQTILIVILTTISTLLLGYIALDKTNIINNKGMKNKEVIKEKEAYDKETTRELTTDEINTLKTSIEEVYNLQFASYYPLEDLDTITNQKLLKFAYQYSNKDNVTTTDIDNIIAKYFSNLKTVKHEDIICPLENIPLYKYDTTTNSYHFNEDHPGHGGGDNTILTDSKVLYLDGIVKDEKEYTINMKVLYGNKLTDTMGPIKSYYKSYTDTTPIIENNTLEENIVIDENTIKNIEEKLPTTTYTFIKDQNNNYGLKSVTIK